YPEVSCRKFCSSEYMGQERKENRRFLGLPLNTKEIIDHTQLSHFRRDLKFSQLVNIPVYILHHLYDSGLLEDCVLHGADSAEIADDNRNPLCYPLVSLLGPADHHDSLYLKPLVELAQAIGIEIKLISADNACHDKEGSLSAETGVHLITPVSNDTSLPEYVELGSLRVKCDQFCEISMIRMGLTDKGHEYKRAADAGECPRSAICPRFRPIAFDDGHFQRIPVDNEAARQAVEMRKNCERPFNLMKKREGPEDAVVRSQHALCGRMTFTMITTLLIEMAGFRKKKPKDGDQQLELFRKAA
ncbi:MAG: transposase, partial [Candidatus Electrothrix sp. AUS1_2]|nr:transposase [Candidatus Electrothrix sp. AUS1_2]